MNTSSGIDAHVAATSGSWFHGLVNQFSVCHGVLGSETLTWVLLLPKERAEGALVPAGSQADDITYDVAYPAPRPVASAPAAFPRVVHEPAARGDEP
jgi:hypothetical protein